MRTAEEARDIVRNTDKYLHIIERIAAAAELGEHQVLCWSNTDEWSIDFLMWVAEDLKNFGYTTKTEDMSQFLRLTISW
jgi:hypothetical protein